MLKALMLAAVSAVAVTTAQSSAFALEKGEKVWDVNNPPVSAEIETVKLDTTSGTWMSLDVSPDGQTIAFDLLGDIYLLPIAGGDAKRITSGLAWDMQPQFSPDGKRIAFTSDRAGGDNIWHMSASGDDLTQLTKESFRLLNNPTWSPDGTYIAAKKHFTTGRSLGTGEVWMYHTQGGNGIKVIARPNEQYQKELGEPVYAPDGKSIYYTKNSTPGNTFIYAQDSNKEIFQINRVWLEDGRIEKVAGGPGGATTATPSPDGNWLAYVKRVRAKSRLFLQNLKTGETRMLFDSLDQDNQETWAVQGVYPNMDWTPDSKSIIFWAQGKIWRINAETAEMSEIPFRVNDDRKVIPAVRRTVDVSPDEFSTKMVRFGTPSPDGSKLVFESLGKLWIKDGDKAPKRLTNDKGSSKDAFELWPVWSPDGNAVYFINWDDQKLGTINRVNIRSGKKTTLSREAGHYTELSINPKGDALLVRKRRGGYLLSPDHDVTTGIMTLPASGGELKLVSRTGTQPHFAPNGRINYVKRGSGKVELVSVTQDGYDSRTLAETQRATMMRTSPDGNHILWQENYHLYVSPLPKTGKTVKLSTKGGALPVQRISKDGGIYANWSQDGKAINWSLGPTLKTVKLADLFNKDFAAPETGVDMSMQVKADKPTATIAITGARIITMAGDDVIENGTIVIKGDRISAIGKTAEIPEGAKIIKADGKTIIPGMIDIHAHGPYGSGHIVPQQNWSTMAHLAFGVTTLHDPSSRANLVYAAAEYQKAGKTLSPRIYSTAEIIYGAKASLWAPVDNLDDALAHVRRLKAQGAVSVKNYNQPRRDQRQQVVEAARQEGLFVVAEGGSLYHMDMNLIADGNTGVEHTLPNQAIYDDVLQYWQQTGTGLVPTLTVAYGGMRGETYWYQESDVWKHPILSKFVPPQVLQPASVRRVTAPVEDFGDADNAAFAKELMNRGINISIGAHGQREGLAAHWEIWSFARGGMTALEALSTATIQPARYFGMDKDVGSLEAGKLADLVILDANPLENIRNTDKVANVMLGGRLYDAKTLNEVETGDYKPKPLYWHGKPENEIR